MADIFVSYKKEDGPRVTRIVEGLRSEGLSVWWDQGIGSGASWRAEIREKLQGAKVVAVVWSEGSITSEWVLEEAELGRELGILCPVRIDDVTPPIGFKGLQASNLIGWGGNRKDPSWRHFVDSILARRDGRAAPEGRPPRPRRSAWPMLGGILGALAALVTIVGGLEQFGVINLTTQDERGIRLISLAERSEWREIRHSRSCNALREYIAADARGAFVPEAQALLAARREVPRETWTAFEQRLPVTAVSDPNLRGSEGVACESAELRTEEAARENCSLYQGTLTSHRNMSARVEEKRCDCSIVGQSWQCTVRTHAVCIGEVRGDVIDELCG